ncbi:MAG: DnaJ domain-containing protein, partial [Nitrospira sp. SB0666_bin_27]|nr:DnaJ domain-containing protein [Nitrospira sp. SB0666_bin_27]
MARYHLDYYATLEVTPQASDEEIKRAYRKLALKYHPDRNQGNKTAEDKIREINAAYEVLGDPETRKSYERLRFGGHGRKADFAEEPAETVNPGVVLEAMEKKLWEEG